MSIVPHSKLYHVDAPDDYQFFPFPVGPYSGFEDNKKVGRGEDLGIFFGLHYCCMKVDWYLARIK